MKATTHFEDALRDRGLRVEWVERVIAHPEHSEVQPDGRIRVWGFCPEIGKHLRVVLLEDGETLHTVFPDRDFTRRAGRSELP